MPASITKLNNNPALAALIGTTSRGSRFRDVLCAQFNRGVAAQLGRVVRILVASHDRVDTLAKQFEMRMVNEQRVARIRQQRSQARSQTEAIIHGSNEAEVDPAGAVLASAGLDRRIKLWRLADRRLFADLETRYHVGIIAMEFSPCGRYLAFTDAAFQVEIVDWRLHALCPGATVDLEDGQPWPLDKPGPTGRREGASLILAESGGSRGAMVVVRDGILGLAVPGEDGGIEALPGGSARCRVAAVDRLGSSP